MACEKCGRETEVCEHGEGHQCHECGGIFCDGCMPRWEIADGELVCRNCAEAGKRVGAISDFHGDIVCSRDENGMHTNVPRRIIRHSPGGFAWGYGGSGPADLALNVLSVFAGQEFAERYHQEFKREFVATLPHEGGTIKREDIIQWIMDRKGGSVIWSGFLKIWQEHCFSGTGTG